MQDSFWQINFWGIVGTATGALGLFISWLNWRYSKPKIVPVKLELETPSYYSNRGTQNEYWERYTLSTIFRNKKGGAGSVEKPTLIIRYPNSKKFFFLSKYEEFRLKPRTERTRQTGKQEMGSYTYYESEVVRDGKAFNFTGGQTIDDELEYVFRDKTFENVLKNKERLEYLVEYHNNFGKRFRIRILNVKEASSS